MKSCKCIPKGRYQWLGWSYSPLIVARTPSCWSMPHWWITHIVVAVLLVTSLFSCCFHTVSKVFCFPTSLVIFSPSSSPIFGSSQVYEFISIEGKVFLTTTKWLEKTSSFNRKYARKNHPKDHQKNTFVLLVHFAPAIKCSSGKPIISRIFSFNLYLVRRFPSRPKITRPWKRVNMLCFLWVLHRSTTRPSHVWWHERVCPSLLLHIPLAVPGSTHQL